MRTLILPSALAAALVVSVLSPFNAVAENGGYKIGVVDMEVLLTEYEKRKTMYDELQSEVDRRQQKIDEMSKRIESMKESYDNNRDTMSDEERFDRENEIESEFATYEAELKKNQRFIDNKEEAVLTEVLKDIKDAIASIANDENYHLILNSATRGPRAAVLFHAPAVDITSKVLVKLNTN